MRCLPSSVCCSARLRVKTNQSPTRLSTTLGIFHRLWIEPPDLLARPIHGIQPVRYQQRIALVEEVHCQDIRPLEVAHQSCSHHMFAECPAVALASLGGHWQGIDLATMEGCPLGHEVVEHVDAG